MLKRQFLGHYHICYFVGNTLCLDIGFVSSFRCQKWVRNADVQLLYTKTTQQLYNFRLCAKHFEDSQFMNNQKNSLVWNAVPTLFDRPHPPKSVTPKRPPPKHRSDQIGLKKRKTFHNGKHIYIIYIQLFQSKTHPFSANDADSSKIRIFNPQNSSKRCILSHTESELS